jgi:hypothetical protein
MSNQGSLWTRIKGKVIRPVAEAAGDRDAEAKARFEVSRGREPTDAEVAARREEVRARHHDTIPES